MIDEYTGEYKEEVIETSCFHLERYLVGKERYIDFIVLDASPFDIVDEMAVGMGESEFDSVYGNKIDYYTAMIKSANTEDRKNDLFYELYLIVELALDWYC